MLVRGAGDDHSPGTPDDLDGRAVQLRQHVAAQHVVWRADSELPAGEVKHTVDHSEDRVHVMGDENHCGVVFMAARVDKFGDPALMLQIEAEERLVTEQQYGITREGLTYAKPLLFASGKLPDRPVTIRGGSNRPQETIDTIANLPRRQRDAESMAVNPECDEVPAAERNAGWNEFLLRDVADPAVTAVHRPTLQPHRARVEPLLAENRLQKTGFARPIRPEHGKELAGPDGEIEPAPERVPAEAETTPDELEYGCDRGGHSRTAAATWSRLAVIQET